MKTDQIGEFRRLSRTRVRRPDERRSLSRSATRALDILEYFGRVHRPLRAIEIAHALNLCPSTTNQLLKTMVESAHLTFEVSSKSYLPSPRLMQFGAWMTTTYGADEQLQTLVSNVQRASGETVTLTTPNDVFMQIIDLAGSPQTNDAAVRGLRVSIFGSTIGSAYLSTLLDADIAKLAARARVSNSDIPGIRIEIARIRRSGVGDGPSPAGDVWSLAAPLRFHGSLAPLVLGLAGPTDRIKENLTPLRALMRSVTSLRHPVSTGTAAVV